MQTTPVNDTSRDEIIIAKEIKSRPFAIRVILHTCRQILRLLRYGIHTTLERLIIPDNSQPSSSSSNAKIRYYRIQFTANDVMKCFALLYIGMKIGAWSEHENVIVQVLGLMSALGIVFRKQMWHCDGLSAESSASPSRDEAVAMHHFPQQQITRQRGREVTTVRQTKPSELQSDTTTSTASTALLNSNKANLQQRQARQRLQQKYPNATPAECKRFYICVKRKENEAAQRIENWLQWRSDCGLPLTVDTSNTSQNGGDREYNHEFIRRDQTLWNEAARLAMELDSKQGTDTDSSVKLPQIMCTYEEQIYADSTEQVSNTDTPQKSPPRARDASRIFHILPAQIDLSLASAPTYSLACALYLDRRLCRCTTEKITLLCDVRGGRGWANPTPWSLLPFVQSTSSLLGKQYPERLRRFVLFPMPGAAAWIWSAAQKCLDPDTASKVVVVGEEKGKRGMPARMREFFDEESLRLVEERRISLMAPGPVNGRVSEECVRAMLSC